MGHSDGNAVIWHRGIESELVMVVAKYHALSAGWPAERTHVHTRFAGADGL